MNKIININLAGRLIPIDEVAYEQLRKYIDWLKQFFGREEGGNEIVHDMEDRIGELFQNNIKRGASCITEKEVSEMIAVMGSPEQIVEEAGEEEKGQASFRQDEKNQQQATHQNRLSRSGKEKVIGGVCGGIAAHFNIDPAWVRIAFAISFLIWGAGILVYLLLWILLPESNREQVVLKRRLYRDPEHKVAGGVCGGIAAYFNIDPIIPRLIFALPLLGIVFFGVVNDDVFFFPAFLGGLPTLVILYIVLWASLPKPMTMTEKLEMRGTKVDVQNLSYALKTNESNIVVPRKSGIGEVIAVAAKAVIFIILGFVLLVMATVIIGILAALSGLAISSAFTYPLLSLATESATQQNLLWICLLLVIVIPFVAIIRLLARMITGRKKAANKWLNIGMVLVFSASVFCLFWIGGSIANDFSLRYKRTETLPITQPLSDTIVIKNIVTNKDGEEVEYDYLGDEDEGILLGTDGSFGIPNVSFNMVKSPDSLFHLTVQKSAYGKDQQRAKDFAEKIEVNFNQEQNTIYIPRYFMITNGKPFRGQQLKFELQIPKGKYCLPELWNYNTQRSFGYNHGRFYSTYKIEKNWEQGRHYKMTDDGLDEDDDTIEVDVEH